MMSKAVLISIQPHWCELIASGEKTLEVRKARPKLETPFKCYIYMTSGDASIPDGKGMVYHHSGGRCVIGEFMCDRIECFDVPYPAFQNELDKRILHESCCTYYQLHRYAYHDALYGWHISDLVIYDKPKVLTEFMKPCESDLYCEVCAMFREFEDRCGNKALMLSMAPQSWCYVEELKGGDD